MCSPQFGLASFSWAGPPADPRSLRPSKPLSPPPPSPHLLQPPPPPPPPASGYDHQRGTRSSSKDAARRRLDAHSDQGQGRRCSAGRLTPPVCATSGGAGSGGQRTGRARSSTPPLACCTAAGHGGPVTASSSLTPHPLASAACTFVSGTTCQPGRYTGCASPSLCGSA